MISYIPFLKAKRGELTAMGQAAKAIIALIEQSEIELEQFRSINVDFLHHDILFHKLLIERSDNMRLVASVNQWRDVITAQLARWRHLQTCVRLLHRLIEQAAIGVAGFDCRA